MIFWGIIGLLTALVLLVLLRPLFGRPSDEAADSAERDLAVYTDQLSEIDRDLAAGNLGEEQAKTARLEIQRRILQASERQEKARHGQTHGKPLSRGLIKAVIVILVIAFPAAGMGLYFQLGSPGMPGIPVADQIAQRKAAEDSRNKEIAGLATQLEARLRQEPQNQEGWMLLGRTYAEIQRFDKAAEAFRQALANGPASAVLHGALGEMLVAQAGGQVTSAAIDSFQEALALDPLDPRGLFYSGLALDQAAKHKEAINVWLTLRQNTQENDPWLEILDGRISKAAAALNLDAAAILAEYPPLAAAEPAGPTAEDVEAAAAMDSDDRSAMIEGMVTRLAERLESQPEDLDGWLRLVRSYHTLGKEQAAREALGKAETSAKMQNDVALAEAKVEALRRELDL